MKLILLCLCSILSINLSSGQNVSSSLEDLVVTRDCTTELDCGGDESIFCDMRNKKCSCKLENLESSDQNVSLVIVDQRLKCLTAKNIGEGCQSDPECRLSDPISVCSNRYCRCQHQTIDPSLAGCSPIKETSQKEVNKAMLPVMIVMGLMFIGICVALNMFSRDSSRGAFNANRGISKGSSSHQRAHRRLSPRSSANTHVQLPSDEMSPETPLGMQLHPDVIYSPSNLDPNQNA